MRGEVCLIPSHLIPDPDILPTSPLNHPHECFPFFQSHDREVERSCPPSLTVGALMWAETEILWHRELFVIDVVEENDIEDFPVHEFFAVAEDRAFHGISDARQEKPASWRQWGTVESFRGSLASARVLVFHGLR